METMNPNMNESAVASPPVPTPPGGVFAWLTGHERAVLIAAVIFQLGVLAAIMVMRVAILLNGQTILLRVTPVDPRDLLRGEYVILSYDFTRPRGTIPGMAPVWSAGQQDRTIYVSLEPDPDGKHWRMSDMSVNPPPTGTTYLRGKVNQFGQVECGIESFFVQEGKGKMYEDAVRDRRLSAEVSVTSDGQAALKRLHIYKN